MGTGVGDAEGALVGMAVGSRLGHRGGASVGWRDGGPDGPAGGEAGWRVLATPYKDVVMSIKYIKPKHGERSVATGKVTGVVDCSAEEAAAWVMDYCSNDRMRISREEGNPARLELREKRRENERRKRER